MQGAILFSNASLKKSKEIRENNVNILKGLQEAAEEKVDSDTLTFREVEADGTPRGFESFQISVELNQKQAKYKDAEDKEESITFYLYGTKTETTTEATTATTTESTGGNGQ